MGRRSDHSGGHGRGWLDFAVCSSRTEARGSRHVAKDFRRDRDTAVPRLCPQGASNAATRQWDGGVEHRRRPCARERQEGKTLAAAIGLSLAPIADFDVAVGGRRRCSLCHRREGGAAGEIRAETHGRARASGCVGDARNEGRGKKAKAGTEQRRRVATGAQARRRRTHALRQGRAAAALPKRPNPKARRRRLVTPQLRRPDSQSSEEEVVESRREQREGATEPGRQRAK
ncbi:hypothetical protein ERJ75_001392100 [Trypanosoma vivax]|nr:hypothetical protein ERJ75_001391900 [Trypanosoma vivax]KAH8607629.1 hypothetical protein ERJ75_001392100 [Trypanosoma vivax]